MMAGGIAIQIQKSINSHHTYEKTYGHVKQY